MSVGYFPHRVGSAHFPPSAHSGVASSTFGVQLEIQAEPAEGWESFTEQEIPEWVKLTVQRLQAVADLPSGWSGLMGRPIEVQLMPIAFQVVQELIPRDAAWVPQIIPTVEGGVQLEWHRDGFDLEIEISCTGEIYADYEDESARPGKASTLK